MDTYRATFVSKKDICPRLSVFTFKKPKDFKYQPGQFVILEIPSLSDLGPREATRSMSLASAPFEKDLLFLMTTSQSKFKQALSSFSPGDKINFKGPFGHLCLPDQLTQPLVFIAGGVGIAPFRGIVKDQEKKGFPQSTYLFYSCRQPQEISFFDYFKNLKHSNFHFIPTVTRSCSPKDWSGETQRIDQKLLQKHLGTFKNKSYFLVGLPYMIKGLLNLLHFEEIPLDRVKTEIFTGSSETVALKP